MAVEQNKVHIEGEETDATVMTTEFDENCGDQIQEMTDHPAFQNEVVIMPDTHYGAGAVIGFTMPISDRVVPNTVGVDIGCGMFAINLGRPRTLVRAVEEEWTNAETWLNGFDQKIREAVPMGRSVFDFEGQDYHIVDDFPWEECKETFLSFCEWYEGVEGMEEYGYWFDVKDGYGKDYFPNTCKKVGYDERRAINSIGTLGGGNHFVEIAKSEKTGDFWVVIHSGSRGIGLKIAKYWQAKATDFTTSRKNLSDVPDEHRQYLKDNWKPDADAIRTDFDGEAIQRKFDELSGVIQEYGPNTADRNTDLDWLQGEEAVGYFIDMIFAQKYASESRKQMAHAVADVLGVEPKDSIESTHNYVDFEDGIIRKGATRAHEGERLIIPFNMAEGTIVCEGKGNPEWNHSAPHGAGRRMSRTQAFDELSLDAFEDRMDGIFSTSVTEETLDEAPQAYKDTAVVESVIDETAEITDRWKPVMNLKAEE